jgi:hypothetical protein
MIQFFGIEIHPYFIRVAGKVQADVFGFGEAVERFKQVFQFNHHIILHVMCRKVAGLQLRQVEQLADEAQQFFAVPPDKVRRGADGFKRNFPHLIRHAEDHGKRRTEFMGDVGEKPASRRIERPELFGFDLSETDALPTKIRTKPYMVSTDMMR